MQHSKHIQYGQRKLLSATACKVSAHKLFTHEKKHRISGLLTTTTTADVTSLNTGIKSQRKTLDVVAMVLFKPISQTNQNCKDIFKIPADSGTESIENNFYLIKSLITLFVFHAEK